MESFLLALPDFRGAFRKDEERETWMWLFEREGRVENVVVAEDESSRIVGHYGMARFPYRVDGKRMDGGVICKLAIEQAYRRSLLFMGMTLDLLKGYSSTGIAFAAGLANRSGLLEFHLAFGFKEVGDVPVYAKPFRFTPVANQVLPHLLVGLLWPALRGADAFFRTFTKVCSSRGQRGVRITPISAFSGEFDKITEFLSRDFRFFAMRDAETLRWRFLSTPFRKYQVFRVDHQDRLVGYFVLRQMEMKGFKVLSVVDLCLDPGVPKAGTAVLRRIDLLALEQGVDLVSILIKGEWIERLLRRNLYLRSPETFTLVVHERRDGVGLPSSRISDWYVTWIDHDYV